MRERAGNARWASHINIGRLFLVIRQITTYLGSASVRWLVRLSGRKLRYAGPLPVVRLTRHGIESFQCTRWAGSKVVGL